MKIDMISNMTGVSVIINTLNEEENIKRVIDSVAWADEIIVCDMYSDDNTAVIAKKLGAKIIFHKKVGFVEPARNFAVAKAQNQWVLVVDADEEIPENLSTYLKEFVIRDAVATYVEIPRKNIIFGKWMKASLWWPDYQVRFFKKGSVSWSNKIHRPPKVEGQGVRLPIDERYAIVHHHYTGISQFVDRMNRYSLIQAKELKNEGYQFQWSDLLTRPLGEFLSRFFASHGFKDGLHGLSLSLLQAFSFVLVYLRLWEMEGFQSKDLNLSDIRDVAKKCGYEINYWFKYGNLSKNPVKRLLQRLQGKF